MDLPSALFEFSELLGVAAHSLTAIAKAEPSPPDNVGEYLDEVQRIAERLREIGDQLQRR